MSDEDIIKNIRGIKVEKENDSLFNNTGLKNNDIFGYKYHINGIEMDGSHVMKILDLNNSKNRVKNLENYNFIGSTYCIDAYNRSRKIGTISRNTYGNSKIISVGMINWTRSLDDKHVRIITKNMFKELLS